MEDEHVDFAAYAKASMLSDPWRGLIDARQPLVRPRAGGALAPAVTALVPSSSAPASAAEAPPPAVGAFASPKGASLASVLADALEVW